MNTSSNKTTSMQRRIALHAIVSGAICAVLASGAFAASTSTQGHPPMPTTATSNPWPIIELRQYTLQPGQRDVLVDLFEREFIESQEAAGMEVLAHTRDLDAPDRFVWFRGFHDMLSRGTGLQTFYYGPVWQAHRDAANATIIDNDNVLLLHEASLGSGFVPPNNRPPIGAAPTHALLVATIYSFAAPVDQGFVDFFEHELAPTATRAGAKVLASYVTDHSANNFPRLPVREGENVFVWVAAFASPAAYASYQTALDHSPRWREQVQAKLSHDLIKPAEIHRLAPAARSLVRG